MYQNNPSSNPSANPAGNMADFMNQMGKGDGNIPNFSPE